MQFRSDSFTLDLIIQLSLKKGAVVGRRDVASLPGGSARTLPTVPQRWYGLCVCLCVCVCVFVCVCAGYDNLGLPPPSFSPYLDTGATCLRIFFRSADPFEEHVGSWYVNNTTHEPVLAVRDHHCNGMRILHGGCLMSFVDFALFVATREVCLAPMLIA